ncbi:MAG: CBS domain-containing protein [Gammaproteobacteria bacterium]|nr:CBS domain-containing protein [Gammaproteobacteria bacterium]NNJ90806.1 CBS domain-containing protein [Gammaproteobacteria bacterium]
MPSEHPTSGSSKNWLDRLVQLFGAEPEDKEDIVEILQNAKEKALLDTDALAMMEGVLGVSDMRVRDIMIPRAQMTVVNRNDSLEDILPVIIESAHSRFPVVSGSRGEVVGILLAKDLLQFCVRSDHYNLKDVLRSAVFVPESKRLNILLKEFRVNRNHMAIVVDEYGSASGFVTIEDVLEQIVGEIEDEHDFDEGATILKHDEEDFSAKALATIEDFNEYFDTELDDSDFDTIGGYVVNAFGHMPKRGESVEAEGFRFTVKRADSRKVHLLNIQRLPEKVESD